MFKNHRLLLVYHCFILSMSHAYTQLYLACLPIISLSLAIPKSSVQFAFTLNILTCGLSQLFYGPLSEQYGRKNALYWGLVLAGVGSLISAYATNELTFITGQLLSGFGAGACSIIPRVVFKDVFSLETTLAKSYSYLSLSVTTAKAITPLIGAWINLYFGWRMIFVFMVFLTVGALLVEKYHIPETLPQKTRLLNKKLINLYYEILKDSHFLVFAGLNALIYSSLVIYLVLTPFVFQHTFNLTPSENAYVYLACSGSYFLGSGSVFLLLRYLSVIKTLYFGVIIALFSLFNEWYASYHLSEMNLILAGFTLYFAGGIITPITYTEILNLTDFLPGLLSSTINSIRMLLAMCISSLSIMIFDFSFNIIPVLISLFIMTVILSVRLEHKQ